ncbi:MAG: phage virion morphogenesis protein [Sterolibacterium sp.]
MITVEINSRSVMDALQQLLRQGQDMRPVMDAIGQRMEERVSSRFETKTDPNGHAWSPFKPSTAKSYPKQGNGTLLDRYGDMLGSLNHHADANSVTVGFGAVGKDGYPYPAVHEFGAPKANIPRRGMLMADPVAGTLGKEDEASIMGLIHGYFAKAI